MILAQVRVSRDDTDWFPGEYEIAALPPIGGHLEIMDRNSNMWLLRVTDVHLEAMSLAFKREFPSTADRPLRVTIFGEETFGNPHKPVEKPE